MLAAKAGHLNVVKKLITSGSRLDITDKVNSLSSIGSNLWQCCVVCQLTVACVAIDLYEASIDSQKLLSINLLHTFRYR